MKKLILTLAICMIGTVLYAQIPTYTSSMDDLFSSYSSSSVSSSSTNTNVKYQKGYVRKDGTYVRGHYKTKSNSTNWDNYSTSNNYNPYTGSTGKVARDYSTQANNYGSGHTIYTGPRGGQYYINSNGNKTYVPKRKKSTLGW